MKSRIVLAYNVAKRRRFLNMTQSELAVRAEMSQRYVSSIEKRCSNVSLEYLDSLAAALQATPSELLDGSHMPRATYEHMLLLDEARQSSRAAAYYEAE